jgi:CHAT domain-containing protein
MTSLFVLQTENPALTRAEALRRAMIGLIDGSEYVDNESGKAVFSYAHPLFWAPFTIVGDGGGGRPAS